MTVRPPAVDARRIRRLNVRRRIDGAPGVVQPWMHSGRSDGEGVFAWCRERLAPHKTPVHWEFVDVFPMTGSGKVQKFVLRERLTARSAG